MTTTLVDTQKIGSRNPTNYRSSGYVFLGRLQIRNRRVTRRFRSFSQVRSDATLDIIGLEYRKDYLNELRSRMKIKLAVFNYMVAWGDDKFAVLCRNRLPVLPSYTEGCPNSLLEAIECGCIPMVTNVGCMPVC